jgi:CRP/FNR family transcriptional regulator, cyclic AMP receptor protein
MVVSVARPSTIPLGGRYLEPDEQAELVREMHELVSRSHLFKTLDEAGRAKLLELGFVSRFEAGDPLVHEGEFGDRMFLVMQGRVRVTTRAASGVQLVLAELGRGACVGEVSVLTGSPRTATVEALERVHAVTFERHRIQRVIDAYPSLRALLQLLVERRAKDTVEKLIAL